MVEAIREGDIPGVQFRRRQLLAETSVEEAWDWLTRPERLARWLCDRAEVAPGPGGGVTLWVGSAGGERRDRGETLEIEAPRRWVLSYREEGWSASTRLTLEISSLAEGTEVMALEEDFQALPLSDCLTIWERSRRRWEAALRRLARVSGGRRSNGT